MDINATMESILELCGVLAIIAGAIRAVIYIGTPYKNMSNKMKKHDDFFANDKRALEELRVQVHYEKECINAIGLAIAELINHEISGNDIGELKDRQRELNKILLQYQQNHDL